VTVAPAALALSLAAAAAPAPPPGEPIVRSPREPARAMALVLGDAGAEAGAAVELADALAARGVLAVVVEPSRVAPPRAGRCWYPAGPLEELAQGVQKRLGLPVYLRPVLVGDGAGASVAWAALEQAPRGTFAGAVLARPCPGRALPAVPCGAPGDRGPPPGPAGAPVAVVVARGDPRCAPGAARGFAAAIPGASLEEVARAELPAAVAAAAARAVPQAPLAPAAPAPVADLPLVEVAARRPGNRLAILLSGDGGWVGLDAGVAGALADAGVGVVGLDSLRYFWRRRTPEETAADVGRLVAHYRAAWGRDEVLLVGYSRGADVVPLLPPRLPDGARAAVRGLALLGPSTFAELEVHVVDLFSSRRRGSALSTEDAVRALPAGLPVLCVEGEDEHDSLCPRVASRPGVRRVVLPGGHHFDRDYAKLARLILDLP
jgi:type IV secretory pathway VirJ component